MSKASFPSAPRPEYELLSSLMDGETSAEEAGPLLVQLCRSGELRSRWIAFHVVGDALRSNEVAATHSMAFCAGVAEAIAGEPALVAPAPSVRRHVSLRRFLAPGLAVAASVAVLGFVAVPLLRIQAPAPVEQQAAHQPAPVSPSVSTRRAATTVANVRSLQAYLAAHRELTTGVASPRATPYLRTTPVEQPEGR